MSGPDRRLTPVRDDLAAERLRGFVAAARFVEGRARTVAAGACPVRREPRPDAPLDSEALFGERVTVYEEAEGWAWAQLDADGYVGYLPAGSLAASSHAPTHRLRALRSFVFPGPSIKLPPVEALSYGSALSVRRIDGALAELAGGGYVPVCHLAAFDKRDEDFVATALRFVGVPYLWGGKTSLGLDCSGLVQTALRGAGVPAARDSDMQEAEVGDHVTGIGADGAGLKRGDLLFWKGHVAIALGKGEMLHANANSMAVTIEPVAAALDRIGKAGSPLRSVKRL